MAIIPSDEKVFMVSGTANTIYSGSKALKEMAEWYTMQDVTNTVRPYKVYTALLTQSGGDDVITISSGAVTEGVTYIFNHVKPPQPWDFSNVGGPVFPNTNDFVATSSGVPNEYGTANLTYNAGAPVSNVLENTLGGDVIWTRNGTGSYTGTLIGAFVSGKYVQPPIAALGFDQYVHDGGATSLPIIESIDRCFYWRNDDDSIAVFTIESDSFSDNRLSDTAIEIKVYN